MLRLWLPPSLTLPHKGGGNTFRSVNDERKTASTGKSVRRVSGVCVQPHSQKYFCFHSTQITCLLAAIPFPMRGAFRESSRTLVAGGGGRESCD